MNEWYKVHIIIRHPKRQPDEIPMHCNCCDREEEEAEDHVAIKGNTVN